MTPRKVFQSFISCLHGIISSAMVALMVFVYRFCVLLLLVVKLRVRVCGFVSRTSNKAIQDSSNSFSLNSYPNTVQKRVGTNRTNITNELIAIATSFRRVSCRRVVVRVWVRWQDKSERHGPWAIEVLCFHLQQRAKRQNVVYMIQRDTARIIHDRGIYQNISQAYCTISQQSFHRR